MRPGLCFKNCVEDVEGLFINNWIILIGTVLVATTLWGWTALPCGSEKELEREHLIHIFLGKESEAA